MSVSREQAVITAIALEPIAAIAAYQSIVPFFTSQAVTAAGSPKDVVSVPSEEDVRRSTRA